jgi:hypothetical protein
MKLTVMRGLWTIAAILWASTRLDAEQTRLLNIAHIVKMAVNAIGPRDEIEQRQIVDRDDFLDGPIMPEKPVRFRMGHRLLPVERVPELIFIATNSLTRTSWTLILHFAIGLRRDLLAS